jgi:hypothetical protein
MRMLVLLFALVVTLGPTAALAHSGGTDRYGCHMDHKTGIRHCH